MILREYKKEDADIIVTWIKTEEELYKWSANRIGKFPLLLIDHLMEVDKFYREELMIVFYLKILV